MPILPYIERILEAARLAPSRDNLQPWRFFVDGDQVSFAVDPERDPSPMNAGGRMARIAVGAALECALVRAGRMGATVRLLEPRPGALTTIAIAPPKWDPEPDKAITRRATNRRVYDGRPVDDATFASLRQAAPVVDAVTTQWFGRERVRVLGPIVEELETLYYGNPRIREATLGALRFDARDRDEVTRGMPLGSLELSGTERVAIDTLRRTPQERLATMGAFRKMGVRARKLIESASGICILTARGSDPATDVSVGRRMQRAWLELTRRGMVAQPISSFGAIEAILELDDRGSLDSDEDARAREILSGLRAAFPSVERGSRIALMLRFGWAAEPTSRAGRRPLDESVEAREMTHPSDASHAPH
jgi:nitroreductase